jgi:hypothetical protein
MKNHPETIERLLRETADMNLGIERERESLGVIEANTQIEIATAKGEDGKPLFSNDTIRKAAFTKAISENALYVVRSQSLEELEKQRLYTQAHVERLKMKFKLYLLDREQEITR